MEHAANDVVGREIAFQFQGQRVLARKGQSVAAALLAIGKTCLRIDEFGQPKGVFCGIGLCWECRCTVNGISNTRACMTPVRQGMVVEVQVGLG